MIYKRKIENDIRDKLFKGKIIVIFGLRQVGKTTLVKRLYNEYNDKKAFYSADIESERNIFLKAEPQAIRRYTNDAKLIVIDEAQNIENIGLVLKVMIDTYPDTQIIVTGSSSFDLANKIKEPLTGRAIEYHLYPLSYEEIFENMGGKSYMNQNLNFFINYGFYPAHVNMSKDDAYRTLELLKENTLYKDIFTLDNIQKPKVLNDLVLYLAYTIGNVVKTGSIAREIKTTEKTVERYIDLLEKMFVVQKVYSFSRNHLNEIKKGYKVYFTDVGFRNAIIKDFTDIDKRNDKGALFENFFIIERLKFLNNNFKYVNKYFWQDYKQREIDYIEEYSGKLHLFECKYNNVKFKNFDIFEKDYKDIVDSKNLVTFDDFEKWLLNM